MSMAVSNESEQRYRVIFSSLIEFKALTSYFLQRVAVWSNTTCINVIVGEGIAYTHLNNPGKIRFFLVNQIIFNCLHRLESPIICGESHDSKRSSYVIWKVRIFPVSRFNTNGAFLGKSDSF